MILGVLVVLLGGGAGAYFWLHAPPVAAEDEEPASSNTDSDDDNDNDNDNGSEENAKAPPPFEQKPAGRVELRGVQLFKDRSGKQLHCVGELFNHGPNAAMLPRGTVHLLSKNGVSLDSAECTTLAQIIQPKQALPCNATFFRDVDYASTRVEPEGFPVTTAIKTAALKVSNLKHQAPGSPLEPHKITGKITNKSRFAAKNAWALAGLYGRNGEVVGSGKDAINAGEVAPGITAEFTIMVYQTAGPVSRVTVVAVGYSE